MKIKDEILAILNNSEGHMTAEAIYLYCKNHDVDVSLATVYRVLGRLAEEGQLRKIAITGQPDLFDTTLSEHEHLICSCCGKVRDLQIKDLRTLIQREIKEDFVSYDLSVRYICPDCRKQED